MKSHFHEERLYALLLLAYKFQKSNENEQNNIYQLYLNNIHHVNNWDLVDSSAHYVVGVYLGDKNKAILYKLCESNSLWERRISVMATYAFIKNNQFVDTLNLSENLLSDKENLIHKAVGWMLREIGKRDLSVEVAFLNKRYKIMPRGLP